MQTENPIKMPPWTKPKVAKCDRLIQANPYFFVILGGSRKKMAKKNKPIKQAIINT
jgi:hypothetical protein